MEAGTITKWRKKVGDHVKAGDVLFEVATDKATVEYSVLDDGWLRQILIKEGQEAIVNQAVAIFTESAAESIDGYKPEGVTPQAKAAPPPKEAPKEERAKPAPASAQPQFTPEPPLKSYSFEAPLEKPREHIFASPLARKLAKERGIDLTTVKGTGPSGRITSRDIDLGQPAQPVTFGRREAPQLPPGSFEEEPLSPMRKIIAERLQESKSSVPHFYVTQEIHADALVSTREQLKNGGLKVSFNDFIVRACAVALREHPQINSGFNSASSQIIRFKTIDISIAVTVDAGLITPIVRHADYKNLGEISAQIKSLAERARQSKLAREEYVGGSFTISNLGMFGITDFVAVINPPQAAILAVGGVDDKPVVKNGHVVPGKTLRLTLSSDHRVIDGSDAAKFLKSLQRLLENPSLLLL
jgi:pyruvate dehydrogenase E2 component (dihydrolipoamide acetyltransferase)